MSMAKIYDDSVAIEPATDHYFAAISFAGEADNLNAQTKALTDLASMYCEKYDKENTFSFLTLQTESQNRPKTQRLWHAAAIEHLKTAAYSRPDCWPVHYYLGSLLHEAQPAKAAAYTRRSCRWARRAIPTADCACRSTAVADPAPAVRTAQQTKQSKL